MVNQPLLCIGDCGLDLLLASGRNVALDQGLPGDEGLMMGGCELDPGELTGAKEPDEKVLRRRAGRSYDLRGLGGLLLLLDRRLGSEFRFYNQRWRRFNLKRLRRMNGS